MRIPTSKQDKGFTLIELLVVVVIIGILAAIAIPVFLNQRQKAADSATQSDLKNAATAMETFYVDKQTYTDGASTTLELATFRPSKSVTVTIVAQDATKYCLKGENTGGSKTFYYDSANGGITDVNCGPAAPPATQ